MKKLLFISNFFPSERNPNFGTFVKTSALQLESMGFLLDYSVVKTKGKGVRKLIDYVIFFVSTLYKLIANNYYFCYVHYLTYSTVPVFVALLFNVKIEFFINIHGDDLVGNRLIHKVMGVFSKYLLHKATGIVVPSHYFKRVLVSRYPTLADNKILVSPSGGVDVRKFFPKRINYAPSGVSEMVFGFVSRIEEGKGWEDLLEAVEMLPCNLNIKIVIFGTGYNEGLLRQKLCTLENRSYVNFQGGVRHEEMPCIFNSMDFFIFPTHRESLGLVLLESMSCGTPAIVSRIDPLIDIVGRDYSLFVDVSSPKSLSIQILRCYSMSKDEYQEIKTRTLSRVKPYSSIKVKESLCKFIEGRLI